MKSRFLIALTPLLCVLALLWSAASASAAATFRYEVELNGVNNRSYPGVFGRVDVAGLNPLLNARVSVRHGSAPAYVNFDQGSGSAAYSSGDIMGMVPGDVIEVRQPQGAALPLESFTVAPATVTLNVGSTSVTGTAPANLIVELYQRELPCGYPGLAQRVGRTGGSFSATLQSAPLAGSAVATTVYSDAGDSVEHRQYLAGETPCLSTSSYSWESDNPGAPPPAKPYQVSVQNLSQVIAPSLKVEHIRGSVVVESFTNMASWLGAAALEPALPGDRFDIYRPLGAPTPSFSIPIPQASAVFDPAVDLVALDGPAIESSSAFVCREFTCPGEFGRFGGPAPAGRTTHDFSRWETYGPKFDIVASDRVFIQLVDASRMLQYGVRATQGDLVAPVQKLSLAKRLRLASLTRAVKRGLRVKLRSSEAAVTHVTLSLGKTKLISARRSIGARTNVLKLRFTRPGKRALRRLIKRGRQMKPQSAKLTAVTTDASGNSSTSTIKLKITR